MKYYSKDISLDLIQSKCIGCKMCTLVCPHGVFSCQDKATIERKDNCIECGACMYNCPTAAIVVVTGTGCAAAILNNQGKC